MTPVQITEDSRLSDERLRAILNHANISFDDNGYDPDPREIAALVTEVLAAREADAWQPIETAEKNGKARLVWCPERQNTYVACWDDFCGQWSHFGGYRHLSETPTHWRPLPTPPALKETTNAA